LAACRPDLAFQNALHNLFPQSLYCGESTQSVEIAIEIPRKTANGCDEQQEQESEGGSRGGRERGGEKKWQLQLTVRDVMLRAWRERVGE
jgi:hypothetical protein